MILKRIELQMELNSQTPLSEEAWGKIPGPEALRRSPAEEDIKRDPGFLMEFNRNLERNAHLSRLNEKYLEQKMEEIDGYVPICNTLYECTRARLHELLLLCAANYANNCEYRAVGDLMFNPRLILVHIRGRHEPVAKERHAPLSRQFADRAETGQKVIIWLKEKTTLETIKKPLIAHSYEILESCGFIPRDYLSLARAREIQIADLSAFLCSRGFKDRSELEDWLGRAESEDKETVKSRLLPLDWEIFRKLSRWIKLDDLVKQHDLGAVTPTHEYAQDAQVLRRRIKM
jgi:hypothetical protein